MFEQVSRNIELPIVSECVSKRSVSNSSFASEELTESVPPVSTGMKTPSKYSTSHLPQLAKIMSEQPKKTPEARAKQPELTPQSSESEIITKAPTIQRFNSTVNSNLVM